MKSNSILLKKSTMFYPMLVISLCAGFQFYKYILQVYPSIITDDLMREFKLNGAGLGNLAATFYYTFIFVQLFVGLLLDRFGARLIATLAIFCCAIGVLFFSQSQQAATAWVCRGLIGAGVAFSTVTYLKLASVWFKEKSYALVNGLLATATMAGAVFGQIPLSAFIHASEWRTCLSIVGFAGFLLAIIFFIVIRDESALSINNKPNNWLKEFKEVLQNKSNWLLAAYAGFAFSPISIFGGLWGNPFLQRAYQLNYSDAAWMVSLIFIGLGIGSPILGFLSARFNNSINLMFYCTLISCVSLSLVIYTHFLPIWLVGILLFTFGFSLGAFLISFVLGKELNNLAVTATVIAMINSGDAILTGITEPSIGKLLDLNWDGKIVNQIHYFSLQNYHIALSLLPIYMIVAAIILLKLKKQVNIHSKNK